MNHLKLAVNNHSFYAYHRFSATTRETGDKHIASVSVQFYNDADELYCSKIVWRSECLFAATAKFRACRVMDGMAMRDKRGHVLPEVLVEQGRKVNKVRA